MQRGDAAPARRGVPMAVVLGADAVVSGVAAVVLLAATWSALFEHLSKFRPVPWIYAQLAGAAFLGLALLCWRARRDPLLRPTVARAVAVTDAIAFVAIAVWLFSDDRGIPSAGSLGSWVFDVFDVTLLVLAVLAGRAFYRRDL
jgi:hypothetical protein